MNITITFNSKCDACGKIVICDTCDENYFIIKQEEDKVTFRKEDIPNLIKALQKIQ